MIIPASGAIKFSNLQSVFGGVPPISFSEYYVNSTPGYTSGVSGIASRGNPLRLGTFYGKSIPFVPSTTAIIYYDPGQTASYPGSGTTLTNIGQAGSVTGTTGLISGVAYNSGVAGGVFDFDGISDKITFGQYNFPATMTVMAWVYPRSEFSINNLMSNAGANLATNGFKLSWNNWETQDRQVVFEAGNGSSGNVRTTPSDTVVENSWQMLTWAINFNTPTVTIYKNITSQTLSGGIVSSISRNNPSWWLGAMGGSSYQMDAYLGEFKIWDSTLTLAQITTEYNASKARYGL
jgi:hypothetical protein